MAINVATILTAVKAVGSHPITQGGSLATLITGGLYAASIAGVVIPTWAFTVGPLAGYALYRFLPKRIEDEIDNTANEIVDIAKEVPQTYSAPSDFPNAPNENPTPNNLNKESETKT